MVRLFQLKLPLCVTIIPVRLLYKVEDGQATAGDVRDLHRDAASHQEDENIVTFHMLFSMEGGGEMMKPT